jgi:transposase-like protein
MNGNGKLKENLQETEVVATAQRRQYSTEYKERILSEIDQAREPGQIGEILRREGLYSQIISKWRAQRKAGYPGSGHRGPQANPQAGELARLKAENERLRAKLERAETIIEVQKKVSLLLGLDETEATRAK